MAGKHQWNMLSAVGGEMLEVRDGHAVGRLPLSETVMQPTRVFHAGAIVTLADEVASAAIMGAPEDEGKPSAGRFPYSIQLSLNLLTNDPVGPLTAEAKVIRRGRMTVVETTVTTSNGRLAAILMSTHMMVNASTTGPHKPSKT